jgi:hypothetical protein
MEEWTRTSIEMGNECKEHLRGHVILENYMLNGMEIVISSPGHEPRPSDREPPPDENNWNSPAEKEANNQRNCLGTKSLGKLSLCLARRPIG